MSANRVIELLFFIDVTIFLVYFFFTFCYVLFSAANLSSMGLRLFRFQLLVITP